MNDCLFCKIVAKIVPADIVYEDADTLAFLDIHPVHSGHILVIPKIHMESFRTTSADILQKVILTAQKISFPMLKAVNASAMNIISNDGKEAGQVIHHMHFHLIPRFADDGYVHWKGKDYTPGESTEVQKKIISYMR